MDGLKVEPQIKETTRQGEIKMNQGGGARQRARESKKDGKATYNADKGEKLSNRQGEATILNV